MFDDEGLHSERYSLIGLYNEIRSRRRVTQSAAPFEYLMELIFALKERSISVPGDEVLSLGTMMNIDMEKLLEVRSEARMKRFWSLQSADLGNLIFWTGRRLTDEGYRWAPASFLDQVRESLPDESDLNLQSMARRIDSGLLVKYPGVILGRFHNAYIARRF